MLGASAVALPEAPAQVDTTKKRWTFPAISSDNYPRMCKVMAQQLCIYNFKAAKKTKGESVGTVKGLFFKSCVDSKELKVNGVQPSPWRSPAAAQPIPSDVEIPVTAAWYH